MLSILQSSPIRQLIYLFFASIFSYSLLYDFSFQPRIGHAWYLSKAVMLTNANFILVTVYSIIQFANSILNNKWLQTKLDFVFFTIMYPIGFCTCVMFWGLYAFDPDFVMPEWIRKFIPEWLNQVTHTLPLIFSSTDAFLTRHRCPSWKVLFFMSVLMTFSYWTIVFIVKWTEGYWLYPIFDLLNVEWWSFVIFSVVFLYLLDICVAVFLTFLFWGKPQSEENRRKRR